MGIEEIIYVTTTLLVIVGALNWGAYALGHNLVGKLGNKNIQNAIYYLIAISGIVSLVLLIRNKYGSSSKTFGSLRSKPDRMEVEGKNPMRKTPNYGGYFKSGNNCTKSNHKYKDFH